MNRQPRVSVALATYQGERWIAEQLQSILEQSRPVDEIVLADDGSSDATVAIVHETLRIASERGAAPALVELPPGDRLGPAANFERALRAATGEVVLLSDQDDVWRCERVAETLQILRSDEHALLVHADARLIDGDGRDLGTTLFGNLELRGGTLARIHAGDAWGVLLRRNIVTGAATTVRRELLDLALPVPQGWLHDEWLGMVAAALDGVRIDSRRPIGYRQHAANQVGVAAPTLRRKLSRLTAGRRERNERLHERARSLADRLPEVPGVPPSRLQDARRKLEHEERRSALPASRIARVPGVVRGMTSRDYARFGGGVRDALRDLIQPAK